MPKGDFIEPGSLLSWQEYGVAASAIATVEYSGMVDQEDTLMIQLTAPQVGMLTLGSLLVARMFPELFPVAEALTKKLLEVSDTQEYFQPLKSDEDGE